MVKVLRFPENPLITPADVPPSREDFEVIGSFNAGVIRHGDEILMLMRVAERPVSKDPAVALVPVVECSNEGAGCASGSSTVTTRLSTSATPGSLARRKGCC